MFSPSILTLFECPQGAAGGRRVPIEAHRCYIDGIIISYIHLRAPARPSNFYGCATDGSWIRNFKPYLRQPNRHSSRSGPCCTERSVLGNRITTTIPITEALHSLRALERV